MKKIIIIGPFPPPVYGMSKNLKIVADILSENSEVIRIGISPTSIVRNKRYYLEKVIKGAVGACRLSLIGLTSRKVSLYMPPDAGLGMYYSVIFVTIARLLKMKMFFHHRSFAYINEYSKKMSTLVKMAGDNATHIFLCKNMEDSFRQHYSTQFCSMIVSNAQHVNVIGASEIKPMTNTFVIGHLSNLGFDKGLKDIFDLLEKLIQEDLKVKLILAGPAENLEVETFLNSNLAKYGAYVEYRGYVDKAEKQHFFQDIDLFLFPSRYKHEAQPNVIFEANGYGVPVLTLERGCIDSDVDEDNGAVLDPVKEFAVQALPILKTWLSDPDGFMKLKYSTQNKTQKAMERAEFNFRHMINEIKNQ